MSKQIKKGLKSSLKKTKTVEPGAPRRVKIRKPVENKKQQIRTNKSTTTPVVVNVQANRPSTPKLTNHQRIGVSSQAMNVRSTSRNLTTMRSNRVYIGALTGKNGLAPGDLLFSRRNYASVPGSLLQIDANTNTRWRVHKQRYVIEPSVGSTASGQIIVAQDPDPTSKYSDNSTNIQQLSVLKGSSIHQTWQRVTCDMPRTKQHDNLFTQDVDIASDDYTERFSAAGNFFVACIAVGDMGSDTYTVGSIFLEYTYEFYEPRLQLNLVSDPTIFSATPSAAQASSWFSTGASYWQSFMSFVGTLTLATDSIYSAVDAINMWFNYLPYQLGLSYSDNKPRGKPDGCRYDLGVSPYERVGYGPGLYANRMKIWMTTNTVAQIFDYFYNPPTSSASGWAWDFTSSGGAVSSYPNQDHATLQANLSRAIESWFYTTDNTVYGDAIPVSYSAGYSGVSMITNSAPTAPFPYISIWGGAGVRNPLDGLNYASCWSFDHSFEVRTGRGYVDLSILFNQHMRTDSGIQSIIMNAASTGGIVVTYEMTNKDSTTFLKVAIDTAPKLEKKSTYLPNVSLSSSPVLPMTLSTRQSPTVAKPLKASLTTVVPDLESKDPISHRKVPPDPPEEDGVIVASTTVDTVSKRILGLVTHLRNQLLRKDLSPEERPFIQKQLDSLTSLPVDVSFK